MIPKRYAATIVPRDKIIETRLLRPRLSTFARTGSRRTVRVVRGLSASLSAVTSWLPASPPFWVQPQCNSGFRVA